MLYFPTQNRSKIRTVREDVTARIFEIGRASCRERV